MLYYRGMKIKNPMMAEPEFFGSTTVGEKGQVVIPSEARTKMKLAKGEKLLVFGRGGQALILVKLAGVEKLTEQLSQHLSVFKKAIQKHQ